MNKNCIYDIYMLNGTRYFRIGEISDSYTAPIVNKSGGILLWDCNYSCTNSFSLQFLDCKIYILKKSIENLVDNLLGIQPPLMSMFELFSGAIKTNNNFILTFCHGILHNSNGPAVEHADGTIAWYLDGILLTTSEYWEKQKNTKNASVIMAKILGTK